MKPSPRWLKPGKSLRIRPAPASTSKNEGRSFAVEARQSAQVFPLIHDLVPSLYREAHIQAVQDSLSTRDGLATSEDALVDPVSGYVQMRNWTPLDTSDISPLARLSPEAISKLLYKAWEESPKEAFSVIKTDVMSMHDALKEAAALLMLIRIDLVLIRKHKFVGSIRLNVQQQLHKLAPLLAQNQERLDHLGLALNAEETFQLWHLLTKLDPKDQQAVPAEVLAYLWKTIDTFPTTEASRQAVTEALLFSFTRLLNAPSAHDSALSAAIQDHLSRLQGCTLIQMQHLEKSMVSRLQEILQLYTARGFAFEVLPLLPLLLQHSPSTSSQKLSEDMIQLIVSNVRQSITVTKPRDQRHLRKVLVQLHKLIPDLRQYGQTIAPYFQHHLHEGNGWNQQQVVHLFRQLSSNSNFTLTRLCHSLSSPVSIKFIRLLLHLPREHFVKKFAKLWSQTVLRYFLSDFEPAIFEKEDLRLLLTDLISGGYTQLEVFPAVQKIYRSLSDGHEAQPVKLSGKQLCGLVELCTEDGSRHAFARELMAGFYKERIDLESSNLHTWTALIHSCSLLGDTEAMFLLLKRLLNEGITPDGPLVNILLTLLVKSDEKSGLLLYNNLKQAGFRPESDTIISIASIDPIKYKAWALREGSNLDLNKTTNAKRNAWIAFKLKHAKMKPSQIVLELAQMSAIPAKTSSYITPKILRAHDPKVILGFLRVLRQKQGRVPKLVLAQALRASRRIESASLAQVFDQIVELIASDPVLDHDREIRRLVYKIRFGTQEV